MPHLWRDTLIAIGFTSSGLRSLRDILKLISTQSVLAWLSVGCGLDLVSWSHAISDEHVTLSDQCYLKTTPFITSSKCPDALTRSCFIVHFSMFQHLHRAFHHVFSCRCIMFHGCTVGGPLSSSVPGTLGHSVAASDSLNGVRPQGASPISHGMGWSNHRWTVGHLFG